MDRNIQLAIYQAQTENVKELARAWKHLKRCIHHELRRKQFDVARLITKSLTLVFCSWAEANFSKMIHTPHGFELAQIAQIKETWDSNGLGEGWRKCLELGLLCAGKHGRSNYLPNIRQRIERIIEKYAVKPNIIRNKIAHGQWKFALNREGTAVNQEVTDQLNQELDLVHVETWKEAHRILAEMMESLVESPERAFHRDYWGHIEKLDQLLIERESWDIHSRATLLQKKPISR